MTARDEADIRDLRDSVKELHESIALLREERNRPWPLLEPADVNKTGWNFATYSVHINQRFSDLSLQLQQRFEAQQTSVSTAMVAAEKAVNAALTAAEKAVDKAEQAQALRNEAQNEFRKSLGDLSALMWTSKEGSASLDSLRREMGVRVDNAEDKIAVAARERVIAIDNIHREVGKRVDDLDAKLNSLISQASNLQGRFAMIGIVWGVIVVVASAAIRYFK